MGDWLMKTVFELESGSRCSEQIEAGIEQIRGELPDGAVRDSLDLPELGEREVVKHYTNLSRLNYSVDTHFYPLGSCTMKYNPKINERVAGKPGLSRLHPLQDEDDIQGLLRVLLETERFLCSLTGMDAFSLQPAAGAQGELSGMLIFAAWFRSRKEKRNVILIPDSAHGTNPASCALAGFRTVTIKTDARGNVDLADLEENISEDVAGLMITNPNTLGLFDEHILEIAERVHSVGGLLYYDGANFNAIMGSARPGDMGFDVVHLNLHKTFSTPHGGGGPGAGPVGVRRDLAEFLPGFRVREEEGRYRLEEPANSIGSLTSFAGPVAVIVRAWCYILAHGGPGLRNVSCRAVQNANYLFQKLKRVFDVPFDRPVMHEFVLSGMALRQRGVRTLDFAKRLLDYGFYAPTVYFPLSVPEAIMVEPTETESRKTLDSFVEAVEKIIREIEDNPELVKSAPHTTPVRRVNEVLAARHPVLKQ